MSDPRTAPPQRSATWAQKQAQVAGEVRLRLCAALGRMEKAALPPVGSHARWAHLRQIEAFRERVREIDEERAAVSGHGA